MACKKLLDHANACDRIGHAEGRNPFRNLVYFDYFVDRLNNRHDQQDWNEFAALGNRDQCIPFSGIGANQGCWL
jgi:hypothetical protein